MEKTEMELKLLGEKRVNGIITKANWQVEGEKSTRYFCYLEKRHYLDKTIPNLILEFTKTYIVNIEPMIIIQEW